MKNLSYSNVKYTPRVPLILLTVEKIECENFNLVLLSFSTQITQKLHSAHQTKQLLYYQRLAFSGLELHET